MDFLKKITEVLEKNFPDNVVFTEPVRFTGRKSCFFVKKIDSKLTKELNDIHRLTERFLIQFYEYERNEKKCLHVADQLDVCMQKVDGICSKKKSFKIVDGVLSVDYDFSYRVKLEAEDCFSKMRNMEIHKIGISCNFNDFGRNLR